MKMFLCSLVALLTVLSGMAVAQDLSKIDRDVGKQPTYASKAPRYCLLVFGPKADTRVWLVLDLTYDPLREKPGKADALHADLNGDRDLTGEGERIPATVVIKKEPAGYIGTFPYAESELHLPRFTVGDVKGRDGTIVYKNLVVDVGWFIFGRKDREVQVAVDVPGYGRQVVSGEQLWFADSPAKAPVIWFGGALTLRLAPSGLLHLPVDYTGKEPPPPRYEEFPLVRGKKMPLRVELGSAGIGLGTFNVISNDKPPADVHPIAKVVFPHADPKKPPIEVSVDLNKRCCGTLFQGSITVPADAGLGKAKVTLSFPGWHGRDVVPTVADVSVSDEDTRPKVFRDDK
jgi:hypothetical protein